MSNFSEIIRENKYLQMLAIKKMLINTYNLTLRQQFTTKTLYLHSSTHKTLLIVQPIISPVHK